MADHYAEPEQVLDDASRHNAVLSTSMGDIALQLFSNEAPIAANSFALHSQADQDFNWQ